jgi:hypothetical protein
MTDSGRGWLITSGWVGCIPRASGQVSGERRNDSNLGTENVDQEPGTTQSTDGRLSRKNKAKNQKRVRGLGRSNLLGSIWSDGDPTERQGKAVIDRTTTLFSSSARLDNICSRRDGRLRSGAANLTLPLTGCCRTNGGSLRNLKFWRYQNWFWPNW